MDDPFFSRKFIPFRVCNLGTAFAVAVGIAIWFSTTRSALAQPPETAFQQASQSFDQGNYAEAAEQFEQFTQNYPTSALIFSARLRLAFALFLTGDFENATAQIEQLLVPNAPVPDEVRQQTLALRPRITAGRAGAMDPGSAERATLFEKAMGEFGEYLEKHPAAEDADQAFYGRALAAFQIQNYEAAIADLRTSLEKFPQSGLRDDTRYLLALALSAKAGVAAMEGGEAAPSFDEAQAILEELRGQGDNLAVSNDATFQLGQTLVNRAATIAEGEERRALYMQAMEIFREVKPKDVLLAAQNARIEQLRGQLRSAGVDQRLRASISRAIERESQKTAGIEARPDQKLGAFLKVAEIQYRLEEWNRLRTMTNFLEDQELPAEELASVKFYKTASYAAQLAKDRGVTAYEEFNAQHRGAPIAENLPLLMGNMFLDPSLNDPESALKYFAESRELYPGSDFTKAAGVQQSRALVVLQRYDEAGQVLEGILKSELQPELRPAAELALGIVREQTGKLDEALQIYDKVRTTYSDAAEAEEAFYRYASTSLQKGDAAGAEREFTAFVERYPDGPVTPTAMYLLAQSKEMQNKPDEALAGFRQAAEAFPKSDVAPIAYFQVARLLAARDDRAGMVQTLRNYLEKYPEHANHYDATTMMADMLFAQGDVPGAVEAYERYVESRSQEPGAPVALLKMADYRRAIAGQLGRYVALNEDEKSRWTTAVDAARTAAERVVREYPDSAQAPLALARLLELQELLVESELQKPETVETYFTSLAESFSEAPATRSKVLFSYAGYVARSNEERALEIMTDAFDSALLYAPSDLDRFGLLLAESGAYAQAREVFEKLAADYPPPGEGQPPTQEILDAQAGSLYGLAILAQNEGDQQRAQALFEQLKKDYPSSAKTSQATIGIARSLTATGKHEDALNLLSPIIGAPNAASAARAEALYLGGLVHKAMGNTDLAIDFMEKCQSFFPGEEEFAAPALLEAAKLLIDQTAAAPENEKRTLQDRIRAALNPLVEQYAARREAAEGRELLGQLPPAN